MKAGSIITRDLTFKKIIQGLTRDSLPKDTIFRGMTTTREIRRLIFKNNQGRIATLCFVASKIILNGRSLSSSIVRILSTATTLCKRPSLIIEVLKQYIEIEARNTCHYLDLLCKLQTSIQIDIS